MSRQTAYASNRGAAFVPHNVERKTDGAIDRANPTYHQRTGCSACQIPDIRLARPARSKTHRQDHPEAGRTCQPDRVTERGPTAAAGGLAPFVATGGTLTTGTGRRRSATPYPIP